MNDDDNYLPPNFKDFWDDLLAQSKRIPLNETIEAIRLRSNPKTDVSLVHYNSIDNLRIAGWYCLPHERPARKKLPAIIYMPGYISEPSIPIEETLEGYATFGVITRGKLMSNSKYNPGFPGLLTHNIEDINKYSLKGIYIDAIRAIDFLFSRKEIDRDRIGITGGSQGGGLTIVAAALRHEIRAAVAAAPFPCGFQTSVATAKTYPFEEIADYLRFYPDRKKIVINNLRYFDVINFARFVQIPIMVHYGVQDNVCPVKAVVEACEAIPSENKKIYAYDGHGHDAGKLQHKSIIKNFFSYYLKNINLSDEKDGRS